MFTTFNWITNIFNKFTQSKITFVLYFTFAFTFLSCCEFDQNVNIIAPSNLQLSQQNIHTVLLSWSFNGEEYDGFLIDRKIGSGSWKIAYDTVTCNIHNYRDTMAVPAEFHAYRIYSFIENDRSEYITGNITLTFPAPSDLKIKQLSDTAIELIWQDNSNGEDAFMIDRKAGATEWTLGYATVYEDTMWIDDLPVYGTINEYRVYGFCKNVSSKYIKINIENIIIPPIELRTSQFDNQSLELVWTDNCEYEYGYRIERKIGSGNFTVIKNDSANSERYLDIGLSIGIEYKYRVKAFTLNNEGAYSKECVAMLNILDIDGNIYKTVKIGDQWWMAENLKVMHYRNGGTISNVTNNTEWNHLTIGAYCNYNNDGRKAEIYGCLYNWYAVNDSCILAPEGWHVPTDAEWQTLVDYLGGDEFAGNKMREFGRTYWNNLNTGVTNESGFTALPGGYRKNQGNFYGIYKYAGFWSCTESQSSYALYWSLHYDYSGIVHYYNDKHNGFSVRCIKD